LDPEQEPQKFGRAGAGAVTSYGTDPELDVQHLEISQTTAIYFHIYNTLYLEDQKKKLHQPYIHALLKKQSVSQARNMRGTENSVTRIDRATRSMFMTVFSNRSTAQYVDDGIFRHTHVLACGTLGFCNSARKMYRILKYSTA
jgi:hypothetical protein